MIAFLNQIPSEASIRKQLRKIVFGKNPRCPHCRSRKIYSSESRYRCSKCRKPFSLLTGTWLSGMKLNLRTFYALLWCWTQKIPVKQTHKLCHLSEVSVYAWFRTFRLHLPEFEPILEGKVQMDEAYFKNMSLLLAKQVGSRKLAHQMIFKNSVDRGEAARFLFEWVKPKTTLQTDGAFIYKTIDQWWPVLHKVDIHKKFEFGLTSEIEGMFGNLRTFIRRMYHHATPKYLPEYVSEFACRFSSPEIFTSPNDYLSKTLKPVPFA
jgi:transposase-like protein